MATPFGRSANFDNVFEQAYQDSYLPFLDVFEPYHDLRISLHTSGPLMEWLDQRHGDYLDRLARLVQAGRLEITNQVNQESADAEARRAEANALPRYRRTVSRRLRDGSA